MKNARKAIIVASLLLTILPGAWSATRAESFADPAFQATWERTDKLVAGGAVKRSFYWGPAPGAIQNEQYAEGAGGKRLVQYFDKSRMEINNPSANRKDPFYVTNGLLTVELVTGRMQVGNNAFADRYPAQIPLASDTDDANAPTYATFARLMERTNSRVGGAQVRSIDRAGNVTALPAAATRQQQIVYYEPATGHNIPQVFWDFLNASGPVVVNGKQTNARLNDPWFYAAGLPISEPYWSRVKIAGKTGVDVYIQAYQRRVLTYVPSLPESFQVQMGNIGQHYYDWRYKDAGRGDNGATPAPQPSPGKIQITGAASNPLSLDTAALASRNPQTQNLTIDGQTHIWKGPPLLKLLEEAGGNGHGGRDLPIRYVLATGQNGQRALISWGEIDPIFMGTQAILAYSRDGVNLAGAEAPARLIMPRDKTSARSLFGLARLDVRVITTNTTAGSTLRITGAVQHPLNLTADDLAARNPITVTATYTAGGQIGSFVYKGVPLVRLLNEAGIAATSDKSTRYIVAAGNDGRNAVISWGEIDPDLAGVNVLVAYQQDGVPLGGGIPRLVMPADARGGRYLPYLTSIEVRNAN